MGRYNQKDFIINQMGMNNQEKNQESYNPAFYLEQSYLRGYYLPRQKQTLETSFMEKIYSLVWDMLNLSYIKYI